LTNPHESAESVEPKWSRETPWRQGSFLPRDCAAALGLVEADDDLSVAIVVSHDCDLAQSADVEPDVEVIVGPKVDAVDGNYAHAKNARMVHLACPGGSDKAFVALQAHKKTRVPKECSGACLATYEPNPALRLDTAGHRILQRWLAARYRRAAFPDEFDKRLTDTKVRERLAKALAQTQQHIAGVFFDVDGGEETDREGADDPYELGITLLYSAAEDPDEALGEAKKLKERIDEIFDARCKVDGRWHSIELVYVQVISDEAMTVAEAQRLNRWHADHISLRADPVGPIADS